MIVKCLSNEISRVISNQNIVDFLGVKNGVISELKVKKFYLVLGISFGPYCPWLFCFDEYSGLRYAIVLPIFFFEIIDSRFSRHWRNGVWFDRNNNSHTFLAPKSWINNSCFLNELLEGDNEQQKIYENLSNKLLLEFRIPLIQKWAIPIDSELWVSDPDYLNCWESNKSDELTKDPLTGNIFINPFVAED